MNAIFGFGTRVIALWREFDVLLADRAPDTHSTREYFNSERDGYGSVENWVMQQPDLKLYDVEKHLASEYGLLLRDVRSTFRRLKSVFRRMKAYAVRIHAAVAVDRNRRHPREPWAAD